MLAQKGFGSFIMIRLLECVNDLWCNYWQGGLLCTIIKTFAVPGVICAVKKVLYIRTYIHTSDILNHVREC